MLTASRCSTASARAPVSRRAIVGRRALKVVAAKGGEEGGKTFDGCVVLDAPLARVGRDAAGARKERGDCCSSAQLLCARAATGGAALRA